MDQLTPVQRAFLERFFALFMRLPCQTDWQTHEQWNESKARMVEGVRRIINELPEL